MHIPAIPKIKPWKLPPRPGDPEIVAHGMDGPIVWHVTTSTLHPGRFLIHASVRSMLGDGFYEGDQAGAEEAAKAAANHLKNELIAMLGR